MKKATKKESTKEIKETKEAPKEKKSVSLQPGTKGKAQDKKSGKKDEPKKSLAVFETRKTVIDTKKEEKSSNNHSLITATSNNNMQIEITRIDDTTPMFQGTTTLLPLTERDNEAETPRDIIKEALRDTNISAKLDKTTEATMRETKSKESFQPSMNKQQSSEMEEVKITESLTPKNFNPSPRRYSMMPNALSNNLGRVTRDHSREPSNVLGELKPNLTITPTLQIPLIPTYSEKEFVAPDVGGTMQIRVISRFRPLNSTERVNITY